MNVSALDRRFVARCLDAAYEVHTRWPPICPVDFMNADVSPRKVQEATQIAPNSLKKPENSARTPLDPLGKAEVTVPVVARRCALRQLCQLDSSRHIGC